MVEMTLPSGVVLDFEDATDSQIQEGLSSLKKEQPELFEDAQIDSQESAPDLATASYEELKNYYQNEGSSIRTENTDTEVSNEGEIPIANYRLNSTNVITKGNVRSADISVRDTGDIALEDATYDTHGYLIINSTSGSSTNAGENFDLEGATGITY